MTTVVRAPRTLFRVTAERVVVRRVGGESAELTGAAALAWVAADEPATLDELAARIAELDLQPLFGLADAVRTLVDGGLLVEVDGR